MSGQEQRSSLTLPTALRSSASPPGHGPRETITVKDWKNPLLVSTATVGEAIRIIEETFGDTSEVRMFLDFVSETKGSVKR